MKRTFSLFLAAVSLFAAQALLLVPSGAEGAARLSVESARASTRPRYGGTLRIQLSARVANLDPREWSKDPASEASTEKVALLLFDRLVLLDDKGRPQPQLAVSWQHDPLFKRWEFRLRPGVKFHDGSPLTASFVSGVLQSLGESVLVSVLNGILVVQSDVPIPGLLAELSLPRYLILRRASDGGFLGTGPFKLAEWQANRKAVLTAFEDHWGGRPYVDTIEIEMGANHREQLVSLELGRADLVEILPGDARRVAQGGSRVSSSSPVELMALVCTPGHPPAENARIREAIVLSIDRASIHSVLLQRQGEITASLLPQWLSGYAFVFSTESDAPRAREQWARVTSPPKILRLDYDPVDPLLQFIADRIALNAREAGIPLQVMGLAPASVTPQTDMRLIRVRYASPLAAGALVDLAKVLGLEQPLNPMNLEKPEQVYSAERQLLEKGSVIPLFQLPEIVGLSARVKNWMPFRWGEWRLADVWLAPDEAAAPAAPKAPEKP